MEQFIEDLEVGGLVIIKMHDHNRVGTVSRLTKTQILVTTTTKGHENRFKKIDGYRVGGTVWNSDCLIEYTDEWHAAIRRYTQSSSLGYYRQQCYQDAGRDIRRNFKKNG